MSEPRDRMTGETLNLILENDNVQLTPLEPPPARYHLLWPERWANHEDKVYQEHRTFFTEEELIRAAIDQDLPYYDGIAIYGHVADLNSDLINQLTAEKNERLEAERLTRKEVAERATYERLKAKYEGGAG